MSDFLENLLKKRDLTDSVKIEKFLQPKWEDNFDPFFFTEMEQAVKRIWQAVEQQEKIVVFSDYDVDGITGGAILSEFFKKIEYKNFENFIPNRNSDGYGFSEKSARKVLELKPDLVITVDCGITDVAGAKILKNKNKKNKLVDLIITDHHLPNEKIPEALAIIDHKKKGEKYPEQILSGAGIAFKLVQALLSETGLKIAKKLKIESSKLKINPGWEKWLLDLVALATIADMVPLIGENRILAKYGKIVLDKTLRPGLQKIIQKARLNKNNISTTDISFMIAPRINAAARLEDPRIAFEALTAEPEKAIFSAEELEKINNRRKYMIAKIMKAVWKKLSERRLNKVIVIGDKDWPLGMLGLIAGKVADKYQKPTFVWGGNLENLKGSCRSGGKYSVYSLMEKTKEKFVKFGGHAQSGGFEIEFDKIHSLEKKLSENLKKAENIIVEKKEVDAEITFDDVHMDNYKIIEQLEPFGVANQEPVFLIKRAEIFMINYFGKNKEHLELIFKNSKNFNIKAISFYYQDKISIELKEKQKINLFCSLELNTWNGNSNLRLKIENIE